MANKRLRKRNNVSSQARIQCFREALEAKTIQQPALANLRKK